MLVYLNTSSASQQPKIGGPTLPHVCTTLFDVVATPFFVVVVDVFSWNHMLFLPWVGVLLWQKKGFYPSVVPWDICSSSYFYSGWISWYDFFMKVLEDLQKYSLHLIIAKTLETTAT